MDDTARVVVEFREREAFAVLVAIAFGQRVAEDPRLAGFVETLRPDVFVGSCQWKADALVAGLRVWRALGLPGEPPVL